MECMGLHLGCLDQSKCHPIQVLFPIYEDIFSLAELARSRSGIFRVFRSPEESDARTRQ